MAITAGEFRRIALKQPGAVESAHMAHPDFRIGGKIFASLGYPDDEHAMVKLTSEQQAKVIRQSPAVFAPCAGAWGRQGSTSVLLPSAAKSRVAAALKAAAKNLAAVKSRS